MGRRRVGRILLYVPALLLLAVILAAVAAYAWFDPNDYKDRLTAAVTRQTGRTLTIGGKLRVAFTPAPVLTATDVAFANAAGGSRPQMMTAREVQADFAWLPLLRRQVVVTRLTLVNPDLLLERDANGRGNWQISDKPPNQAPDPAPPAAPGQPRPPAVIVQGMRLVDGTVTWRGRETTVLAVQKLDLAETAPDTPIGLTARAAYAGTQFDVAGHFGSLARLRDAAATDRWLAKLSVQAAGASLDVDGSFTAPRSFGGYDLAVSAAAPDLALITPLLPGVPVPPLRDLRLTAHVAAGAPIPLVSQLALHIGASDLDATVPGLKLTSADIALPGLDQPGHATVAGFYAGSPLHLEATGAPAALLPGGTDAPFPLDVSAEIAAAKLHLKATMAHPHAQSGLAATLTATIPDLSAFSPLLHRDLPKLRDLDLATTIADIDGLSHGLALRDLRLMSPAADIAGDVSIVFGDHPDLVGKLTGKHLDIDAVRTALPVGQAPPRTDSPAAAPPAKTASPTVIPDTRFALDALHRADIDFRVDLGELTVHGVSYRAVAGHLLLKNGHLTLDPMTASAPSGAASGALQVDASQSPARVALVLHAPGVAMQPLLNAFSLPDDISGGLQVEADLRGVGDTPHDIAASLGGSLGLAMVGGAVDGRLLDATFGELLRTVRLPGEKIGNAHANVRCFALRLDADHGVAAIRAMLIDVSRLRVTGAGTIDLGRETLALRLRPFVKIAGSGLVVPLHVGGTFRKPLPSVDATATPEAAAALAVDLANKGAAITGVTSALAAEGEKLLGEADTGDCGPALSLARNGKPGPEPAGEKPDKSPQAVDNFLKRLFK